MPKSILLVAQLLFVVAAFAQKQEKTFFELKVYEYKTSAQEAVIEHYLSEAYIPYMQSKAVNKIGVFTWAGNDTSVVKKLFVLTPFRSVVQMANLNKSIIADANVAAKSPGYIDATSEAPAYDRIVTYVIKGFDKAPGLTAPKLNSPVEERVYELRSYESASEKKYWKKVEMFNEGGEVDIFARLGFNAVFYGEVVAGPTMPNLMYMTSFINKADRDAHWQAFRDDAAWKTLSAKKEYDKTVSKNVTLFLKARPYSEY